MLFLTHLCQIEFPTVINWICPFPILGLLGVIFHLANSGEPDQMPRFAASDLVLHCLPMSHKKDPRLIWVKGDIKDLSYE